MHVQREAERKYALGAPLRPDALRELGVGEGVRHHLVAVYYDTPSLALTGAGWALRRREGGSDAGWHLKRPADGDARTEVRLPLSGRLIPAELRAMADEVIDCQPLVPVATLVTDRTEYIVDAGAVVAIDEVCSDTAAGVATWCEAEVEILADGPESLLDAIEPVILAAGGARAGHVSKVARALAPVLRRLPPSGQEASASEIVGAYLATQVGMIQHQWWPVRVDAPDSVHQARVAMRRLRSLLRVYGDFFDLPDRAELMVELKWLGELLGGPRDAEVLLEEFEDLLAGAPVSQAVHDRVVGGLRARHAQVHAACVEGLDSPRAEALVERLTAIVASPAGDRSAPASALQPYLQDALDEVEWRYLRARRRPENLVRWHTLRKRAKAVRYGAETLVSALGAPASELAKAWKDVTETFGVLQDAAVAQELLAEVVASAEAEGEDASAYQALIERQRERARGALTDGREALEYAQSLGLEPVFGVAAG